MSMEDTFNGAKNAFTWTHAYFNAMAEAVGVEEAHARIGAVNEAMGAVQGGMIKEQALQAGVQDFDAAAINALLKRAIAESLGIPTQVTEASPQRVVAEVGRCPVYEAGLAVGMEGAAIEAGCRAGAIRFMDAMAKQMNPQAFYRLQKCRSGPDDHCIEVVEIK